VKKIAIVMTIIILLGQHLLAQSYDPVLKKTAFPESDNVTLIGRWPYRDIFSCFVVGNYAYVGCGESLRIIDVSNPASPNEVGFIDTPASNVCVADNYAYVSSGGLRIIDVSNPTSLKSVGYLNTQGFAGGISISGNYAYVGTYTMGPCGLYIIDVSDPTSPIEVSHCSVYCLSVYVSGNYAYVSDAPSNHLHGLTILDVNDPALPIEIVRYFDTGGEPREVYVNGNYAYVNAESNDHNGLHIFDVSDPALPSEVGFFDTGSSASGVYVSDNYAYVTNEEEGLRVIDVSDPTSPGEVGFFDTAGSAGNVYVYNNYIYVADSDSGLYILQNDLLTTSVNDNSTSMPMLYNLSQNYPNPFNPSTTIDYSLAKDSHVKLMIYNTLGEIVARVVDGIQSRGSYYVRWNAKNQPSGIYIYRFETRGITAAKKMFLQK